MIGSFQFRMNRAFALTVLAAGASIAGMAHADDSSMNPFTGESYAEFSGGADRPTISNPQFDNSASAWRQQNPSGLSERVFQSYSAPGEAWHIASPTYSERSAAVQDFRATRPNGLTEREFQALSSEASAWQLRAAPGTTSVAAESPTAVDEASSAPLGDRTAAFFRRGATRTQ